MKTYNVMIERDGEIVSDFEINATNLREAREKAQTHKRLEGLKGRMYIHFNAEKSPLAEYEERQRTAVAKYRAEYLKSK